MADRFLNNKALTIIEVIVSIVILTLVLGTFGSSSQARSRLLRELKVDSVYRRLAFSELERMLNLIHRNRSFSKMYGSSARSSVATCSFEDFTKIFSWEGRSGKLDALDSSKDARIPLLQMQVMGKNNPAAEQFLAFPHPKELQYGYNASSLVGQVSPAVGTFHNITDYLRTNHPDILPLVSDEFLYYAPESVGDWQAGKHYALGWGESGPLPAGQVPYVTPMQLFTNETAGTGAEAVTYERIRRYVYYRKIRENNIVFKNGIEGRGNTWSSPSIGYSDGAAASGIEAKTTDVDMLYVQHLNNWTAANGSSNAGEVLGVNGTATDTAGKAIEHVGAVGTHSIMVMVIVRELKPEEEATSYSETEFLKKSTIKAIAKGIASPTFGKNILWTEDLSYHRYSWTRVPGIKYR
jgi:type II secretory pathway pseudopilin PulG